VPGKPSVEDICDLFLETFGWIRQNRELCERLKIEAMYERSAVQQQLEIVQIEKEQSLIIPVNLDYSHRSLGLSFEERDKLTKIQPQNIAAGETINSH
jgi:tRNA uridine 5-carboxymethylaminomethyl modification enzyme